MRLLARAEYTGLANFDPNRPLSTAHDWNAALEEIRARLAAQYVATESTLHGLTIQTSAAIRAVNEAVEMSPMPDGEWSPMRAVLGDDLLAELCALSPASIRRYAARERLTPDDVAGRLHSVSLVVSDLAGSYNDYGIRRWFSRQRPQLDGQSPLALLSGGFDPDGRSAGQVRDLAASLSGSGAA